MSVSRPAKERFHTGRKPEGRENGNGRSAPFRLRLAALIGGVVLIAPLAVLGGIAPAVAAQGDYDVTDSVEVGYSPYGVATDSSTNTVYVVNTGDYQEGDDRVGSLTVINGADNAVIATVELPGYATGIAVDEETHAVYIGNLAADAISVIDPALDYALVASIPVGDPVLDDSPVAVAVDADSHTVYVANSRGDSVSVIDYSGPADSIDPDAFSLVANVAVGIAPQDIAVNSRTNTIYAVDVDDELTVLNGADNTVTTTVPVGEFPGSVAVDEELNIVYSAAMNERTMTVVDGADNTVTTTLNLSDRAYDVAVDSSTNTVYAALENGILAVIDGTTNTQTAGVDIGRQLHAVAVNEVTHASYVTTLNAEIAPGTLWAINGAYPATVPAAPAIGTATAGDAQATVEFTAPTDDGGSAITEYTVTASDVSNPANGGQTATGTAGQITVPGLTNGDTYTFTVSATNSVGVGPESAPSNEVTPATTPGAPTIGLAAAGDGEATLTFTAPADDGGAEITGYTVTATNRTTPGEETVAAVGSPVTLTGLTNGDAYTFTVSATNRVGSGPESAASNEVTPLVPSAVPGAPTIGTATAGNAEATVTFTPPADDGGAAITEYTLTATDVTNPANGGQTATGAEGPITVTGLTNGDAYTFTVSATNSVGTGPDSAPSNEVVPATTPGAPEAVSATAGNAEATVAFTAPADNGGAAITEYTVTATAVTTEGAGGKATSKTLDAAQLASGTGSPITVTGLTNGVTYTFTVSATNSVGTGPASAPSNEVTPATTPDAPVIGTATAGNGQATVTFTPPTNDGGAEITEYIVTATDATTPDNGGQTVTGISGPITVTGLTNGDTYTFTVSATNRVGTGPGSAASNAVTPLAPVVPVEPVTPVTPTNPADPGLASTGPDLTLPLGLVGLMLAAGAALLVITARSGTKEQHTR